MKPYPKIESFNRNPRLVEIVHNYLTEYDTPYSIEHVRNICVSESVTSVPPFGRVCGIIKNPDTPGEFIMFCDTKSRSMRLWVRDHPEYTLYYSNVTARTFNLPLPAPSLMLDNHHRMGLTPNLVTELLEAGNSVDLISKLFVVPPEHVQLRAQQPKFQRKSYTRR